MGSGRGRIVLAGARRRTCAAGLALVALAACLPGRAGPGAVTAGFWNAVRERDDAEARALASRTSADLIDAWDRDYAIRKVVLGAVLQSQSQASVETSLTTVRGELELVVELETYLVREDGHWRVDVARTQRELARGLIAASAAHARDAIAAGVHQMGQALEEGVRELEEVLEDLGEP